MANIIGYIFVGWFCSSVMALMINLAYITEYTNKEISGKVFIAQSVFWPVFFARFLYRGFVEAWKN
jgi:hypothetical protein